MHVIMNGEPLKEVYCFKYLWSQVAADGECEMGVVYSVESAEKCAEQ